MYHKKQGKADLLTPSSPEVRNARNCTSTLPVRFYGMILARQDNIEISFALMEQEYIYIYIYICIHIYMYPAVTRLYVPSVTYKALYFTARCRKYLSRDSLNSLNNINQFVYLV